MNKGSLSHIFEVSADRSRLASMEGLRGLAVLLVYLVHSYAAAESWFSTDVLSDWAAFWEINGHAGVDLFFIISGFLLYPQVLPSSFSPKRFAWRRIVRIYPAFLATFILTALVMAAIPSERTIPSDPFKALSYFVRNLLFLPGIFDGEPMVRVAWTLSYEALWYVALPIIVVVFGFRYLSSRARVALLLTLAAMLIAARLGLPWVRGRMAFFFVGAALAEVRGLGRYPSVAGPSENAERLIWASIASAFGATYALSVQFGTESLAAITGRTLLLAVSLGVFCWAALDDASWTGQYLRWTPLRWLGNLSYSYYLTHFLSVMVFFKLWEAVGILPTGSFWYWPAALLGFAATLPLATALFVWVERPVSIDHEGLRPIPSALDRCLSGEPWPARSPAEKPQPASERPVDRQAFE